MSTTRLVLTALLVAVVLPSPSRAACSRDALEAMHRELRASAPPHCGPKALRRVFNRARKKGASATLRAARECAAGRTPNVTSVRNRLVRALADARQAAAAGRIDATCASAYVTELERLQADLDAAANGSETTTTTSPPGTPTTTPQATCATVMLEVDKGDCTGVTSQPRGLVKCGANCDVQTFPVPASGTLRLQGTPAPGDTTVSFGTDCDDDGTVPLGDASPPDCTLSCDCSSEP